MFYDAWERLSAKTNWKQYFNVGSDLIKGMNKGYSGKNKNLMWLNKKLKYFCISYYYCVENNIDYTDIVN